MNRRTQISTTVDPQVREHLDHLCAEDHRTQRSEIEALIEGECNRRERGTKAPLEIYGDPAKYADLPVPQHVIERAVVNLDKIEAIALIRGSYRQGNGAFASLPEAKMIYADIMHRHTGG